MRMLSYKKGSRGDGSLLQNQFTSYLVTSVHRRRKDILIAQMRHQKRETYVDDECFYNLPAPDVQLEDLLSDAPDSYRDVYFENKALEHAVWELTERDRYVLFSRIMAERSFEDLGAELGLGYKGIAAVYARAIKKLKRQMEEAVQ